MIRSADRALLSRKWPFYYKLKHIQNIYHLLFGEGMTGNLHVLEEILEHVKYVPEECAIVPADVRRGYEK